MNSFNKKYNEVINEANDKYYYRIEDPQLLSNTVWRHRTTLQDVAGQVKRGEDYKYDQIEGLIKDLQKIQKSAKKIKV